MLSHYLLPTREHSENRDSSIFSSLQAGHMDYDGMLDAFSITEMLKGLLYYAEEMLAEVMRIERETGKKFPELFVTKKQDFSTMNKGKAALILIGVPAKVVSSIPRRGKPSLTMPQGSTNWYFGCERQTCLASKGSRWPRRAHDN